MGKECARLSVWLERRESFPCAKKNRKAAARRLREVIDSVVNKSNQGIAIKSKFREFIFHHPTCASSSLPNGKSKVDKNAPVPVAQSRKRLLQKSHDITRDVYKNKYH
jgi:predicted RNA-binding Zn ribbon-like protein